MMKIVSITRELDHSPYTYAHSRESVLHIDIEYQDGSHAFGCIQRIAGAKDYRREFLRETTIPFITFPQNPFDVKASDVSMKAVTIVCTRLSIKGIDEVMLGMGSMQPGLQAQLRINSFNITVIVDKLMYLLTNSMSEQPRGQSLLMYLDQCISASIQPHLRFPEFAVPKKEEPIPVAEDFATGCIVINGIKFV